MYPTSEILWNSDIQLKKSYKESRVPELLNKTVASKKNLRFCETTENVDFVAEIVIAEGEIEGFRYKIDGYQDKINRLRQLERYFRVLNSAHCPIRSKRSDQKRTIRYVFDPK